MGYLHDVNFVYYTLTLIVGVIVIAIIFRKRG